MTKTMRDLVFDMEDPLCNAHADIVALFELTEPAMADQERGEAMCRLAGLVRESLRDLHRIWEEALEAYRREEGPFPADANGASRSSGRELPMEKLLDKARKICETIDDGDLGGASNAIMMLATGKNVEDPAFDRSLYWLACKLETAGKGVNSLASEMFRSLRSLADLQGILANAEERKQEGAS